MTKRKTVGIVHRHSSTPEPPTEAPAHDPLVNETAQDGINPYNNITTDLGQEPPKTVTEAPIKPENQVDENVQPESQHKIQAVRPERPDPLVDVEPDTQLVHKASPTAHTTPIVFSDVFIFPYQYNPVLVYPSSLSYPTQIQHDDPSQPVRSEYIAEAYTEHHQRPRQSGFSIYQVRSGQLTKNMDSLRKTTDSFPQDPMSAFPAIFPVTGCLPASPVLPFGVPDHVVYKYTARPYQLARCVRHSLTTCPMCAITPSHSFLGPGESVARGQVFRPNGILRPPRDYTEADEYTFPVGFGNCPKGSGESSLSEIQHPDEADPRRSLLFDPRLDPEVLGRIPSQEDLVRNAIDADTSGRMPDTFCCKDCGGLTWLKTKRTYYMRTGTEEQKEWKDNKEKEGEDKDGKEKKRKNKRGKRSKKAKAKAKEDTDNDPVHDAENHSNDHQYELALGTLHPSHHASFNESWSCSPSWSDDDTVGIFPEESGTTRSLFVQVAVQLQSQSVSTLAAFFGAHSQFNHCTSFDLATATDSEGRLLRELPFERFNRNAPHLAAVALALRQIWAGVIPSHRTAIDSVTRWNSDHSRRKAYRFRAIVVTTSAYVVDLFCNHFKAKWQRHLKQFEPEAEEAIETAEEENGDKGEREGKEKEGKEEGKELEKVQEKKSKKKAKRARDKAKKAKKEKRAKQEKKAKQKADQQSVELRLAVHGHDQYVEDCDDNGDHDIHDEYYDSRTPSSGASSQQCQYEHEHGHQHQHQHHDETWRVLAGLAESMRDTMDFERPGIGRYVYVDVRDMKRLLPNGVLVHLVSRYMDLLRWHGVHVAFCHAQDGNGTEGAQELASQASCRESI
ncbi:hypothetical protein F503_07867 [Ophiostoma piceae UAMH 11346]|uniref:Uncharacterized protein n=1 Tax=Ophiostoma piceae (strain UAMH 11346) TaxID=1262450 RepID=S3C5V5_OPHP1|nr:hypothetical protein F503_07867 [Ophiostoma piceae UAMH 11346]